jgi:hypothetical protein
LLVQTAEAIFAEDVASCKRIADCGVEKAIMPLMEGKQSGNNVFLAPEWALRNLHRI